ncbi:MAG TPA: putative sulfate exporter family transporter, partial [Anaeromyxobacteraceae bacterium]|nr:putative sulfate exporter family transporter [Anaeromyxobacteraceae bacterium]
AMKTGVIVKMSQNVLIGVAAFILSVVWAMRSGAAGRERPAAAEIWHRFPKFVLGFVVASLLFSFVVGAEKVEATKGALTGLRTWWFALAFTSIGLETRFSDLAKMEGGRPAGAFLIGQVFNIFWTLLLAWLIFGGVLFAPPPIK